MGLLHDLARERAGGPPPGDDPDPAEYGFAPGDAATPILLHGVAAVALVRRLLRPLPPALERAVALHPVGDPALSPASLLLMVADLIEPARSHPRAAALREAVGAAATLRDAARIALAEKFAHERRAGHPLHPLSEATLAAL